MCWRHLSRLGAVIAVSVAGLGTLPAQAMIVGGDVAYTITFDSGFVDDLGNPIATEMTSQDRFGTLTVPVTTPYQSQLGPAMYLPLVTLTEQTSEATAGTSTARGAVRVVNFDAADRPMGPYLVLRPMSAGITEVSQYNPNATAVGPAVLRMAYEATFALDETPTEDFYFRTPQLIHGYVGSGDGAYIQFETYSTLVFNTGESFTFALGGDKPMSEGLLNGGGRIDHSVLPGGGEVEMFPIANYGPWSYTPFNEGGPPYPRPPMITVPEGATSLTFSGYFEFQARNDGSGSGIFFSTVPEPASLMLLGLGSLAMLRRRHIRPLPR